jgi:nitric oxide reductase subunit B
METSEEPVEQLSPRWRQGVIWTFLIGMAILIFMSATAYKNAPPIPGGIVNPNGAMVFTGKDILAGQEIFLKYGLMENGTV